MRLVFLGTPPTAAACLEALIEAGHEVALVVTQPDRALGRSRRPRFPAAKQAALRHGLEVHQPRRVRNQAFRDRVGDAVPDALVVVAYGRILPEPVLRIAPTGAVNLHFSLLPAYRGAAPVQWALASGETSTGVTTMQMSAGLDEGDILLQREVPIEVGEHAPALHQRLTDIGARLLVETLARLAAGDLEPRPQRHDQATFAPPLTPRDGQVSPSSNAREIAGRVRGFDPWPGVWMQRAGRRLRLVRTGAVTDASADEQPGTVVSLPGRRLALVCGGGTRLELLEIQPEGRRRLEVADAINGRQLVPGDQLLACVD